MTNYSILDKIAVVLAWISVHTIAGIGFSYIDNMCTNTASSISIFIVSFIFHYKWAYKMARETEETLGL